jgi:hypothetical protein
MDEQDKEPTEDQLKRLYEWVKEDAEATEAFISIIASIVVFCMIAAIIYLATILIL